MALAVERIPARGQAAIERPPARPRLRILFLVDEISRLDGGGTERQILQLIRLARRLGYEPRLAVLRNTEWLTEESAGCPIHFGRVRSIFRLSGLRGCRDLVRWMRRERFTIVQTFFVESNILGPWMARLAGVPVVIGTRRNLDQWQGRSIWIKPMVRRMQRLANRSTDCIVANSQMVADTFTRARRVSPAKMRIAHNGIDVQKFSSFTREQSAVRASFGIAGDQVLVGNISCMRPVKGLLQFIDTARMVLDQDPAMRFLLVGDGDQQAEIEHKIERLGLKEQVFLAGAHRDVRPHLAAMDIGVLSSLAEGFSNSLLEYMASGLPVVATDVGGNREALEETGILVPPDDPAALAQAILTLRSASLRQQLGAAARKRVERFGLEQAEQRMKEIYSEMLCLRKIDTARFEGEIPDATLES